MTTGSPDTQRASLPGLRVLDRLKDEARVSAGQYDAAFHQARRTGESLLDVLIDGGMVSEAELLKSAAALYQTRFVSTERLAKADIERSLLEMVPFRLAERLNCCPLLFDRRTGVLSVVVGDAEDDLAKQIQLVTGARDVKAYLARPAAVKAAIRKHYAGDASGFPRLVAPPPSASEARDPGFALAAPGSGAAGLGRAAAEFVGGIGLDVDFERSAAPTTAAAPARRVASPLDAGPPALSAPLPTFTVGAPDLGHFEATPAPSLNLELVQIFVSLLEQGRAELRGHSGLVARIARRMAERLGLDEEQRTAIALAGSLHDVGKMSSYHLTLLNVSRFDGHRVQAQRTFSAPGRIFEAASLPEATRLALDNLYERWDGQGFPRALAGSQIPVGARILAIVETYADLVANPKNPYRRTLTHAEAADVVRQLAGQLFDPGLVDVLRLSAATENQRGGLGTRARVLVVEPDVDESTVLELRLAERGFDVVAARDRAEAEGLVGRQKFDVMVSEVDLGAGGEGFGLVAALRASAKNADTPFLFFTRRADRQSIAQGFSLGCADYVAKPAPPDVVIAKAGQIVEAASRKRGGGLSGALADMGLPEVVQVLGQSRKTGKLVVTSGAKRGEVVIESGSVVHATLGARVGDEAFFAMLLFKDGEFAFDPAAKIVERTMSASTEGLLLEGMRRIDEGELR